MASSCLPSHGYRVLTAPSGAEALLILQNGGNAVDLVLLDLLMPEMSGWEVWRRMNQAGSKAKVLFSSGFSGEELLQSKDLAGFNFLRKPYNVDELLDTIRKTLDGQYVKIC